MKFKTVSEFIHALEVEGKKFEHPDSDLHFVAWGDSGVIVWLKGPGNESWDFTMWTTWSRILTHDWQEYQPEPQSEPETEEIELEEWITELEKGHYCIDWCEDGATPPCDGSIKTGVTRKVKVPK